jgi:hypothetical protein
MAANFARMGLPIQLDAWKSIVIASQRVGAKRRPMTGSAKQSSFLSCCTMDCFARNDGKAQVRLLAVRTRPGFARTLSLTPRGSTRLDAPRL